MGEQTHESEVLSRLNNLEQRMNAVEKTNNQKSKMIDDHFFTVVSGLYRIFWRSGGMSVAAIGFDENGNRWLAPTNWTSGSTSDFSGIDNVELITTQEEERTKCM